MRILVTADLHYDVKRSRRPTERLAAELCGRDADALVLVGDTAGPDLAVLRACLDLLAGFRGRKLLVAGNHGLWRANGESSLERYERLLPAAAADAGWHLLDTGPVVLGGVGLVGSIGWYDYSFRDPSLGIPEAFYRAKLSPGAARYLGLRPDLLAAHRDALGDRQLSLRSRWMDGVRVDLGMSDEAFLTRVDAQLARHLAAAAGRADRVVAFVHHLPFGELLPPDRPDKFRFAGAFLGAQRLGETLRACPKLTHVYCGHSHWPMRLHVGPIEVVNVGSTYSRKRFEVLDV